VSDGRYIQDFGAGVAAYRFQFLEHFSWDSDWLLPAHLVSILRCHGLCRPS